MNQIQLFASKQQQQQPRRSKSSNDDDKKYVVEEILEKRVNGKNVKYRVKWKGYNNKHNRWVPKENMGECAWLIERFEEEYKSKRYNSVRKPLPLIYLNPPPFHQDSASQDIAVQKSLALYQSLEELGRTIIISERNKMINIQPILTRKRVTFSNTKEVYKYERDSSEEEADTDDNMKSDDDEEYESYDDEKDDALYQDGYYDYE